MHIQPLTFPKPDEPRQKVLLDLQQNGVHILYGTVFLKKGTRIPETGFTRHPQHEISYLHSGSIQMLHLDGSDGTVLKAGDLISMEALEPQAGLVLEDTAIIYLLIG